MKALYLAFIICGLVTLGLILWHGMLSYSGPVIRDTPLMREYNLIYQLGSKLVLFDIPPPSGADSKRIEAFVAAGILSADDAKYIRDHAVEFHGFDLTRTGADVPVFEAICTNTKPPRRIISFADGHAMMRKYGTKP